MIWYIQNLINFFYSPWTKGLCCILLIGEAIGLFFGSSGNKGVIRIFMPMILGTLLFMNAGNIALMIGKILGLDLSKEVQVPVLEPPEINYGSVYSGLDDETGTWRDTGQQYYQAMQTGIPVDCFGDKTATINYITENYTKGESMGITIDGKTINGTVYTGHDDVYNKDRNYLIGDDGTIVSSTVYEGADGKQYSFPHVLDY